MNAENQIALHTDGAKASILRIQPLTFDCGPHRRPPERHEWGHSTFPLLTLLGPFPTTHHVIAHSRSLQSRRRNPIPARIVPVTLRVSPLLAGGYERCFNYRALRAPVTISTRPGLHRDVAGGQLSLGWIGCTATTWHEKIGIA